MRGGGFLRLSVAVLSRSLTSRLLVQVVAACFSLLALAQPARLLARTDFSAVHHLKAPNRELARHLPQEVSGNGADASTFAKAVSTCDSPASGAAAQDPTPSPLREVSCPRTHGIPVHRRIAPPSSTDSDPLI
jgi:hypothetical protein